MSALDIFCQCLFSSSNRSKHCQTFHFQPPCLPRNFVKMPFKRRASTLQANVQIYSQIWHDDELRGGMCKQNQETASVWGEKGVSHPLAQPCMFLNQISRTCKQRCQAVLSQRLIFWEPSKRHLIFKWADRWRRVSERARVGGRWRSSWLMVQWHVVAAGFMSQSKSEYWEHGRHVTPVVLRIIWQCIMLEICHVKKMSMPSPVATITTCSEVKRSPPLFMPLNRGPLTQALYPVNRCTDLTANLLPLSIILLSNFWLACMCFNPG